MSALKIACEMAKKFEGLKLEPYMCPAGIWTIGYGTTSYPDGTKVSKLDKPITKEQAEEYLEGFMAKCLKEALDLCPNLKNHSEERKAALADFVYNLGESRLASSTLRKKVLEEDWPAVKEQLMRWVYAGSVKLKGLEIRRRAEASLI